jgi:hypothetical protein
MKIIGFASGGAEKSTNERLKTKSKGHTNGVDCWDLRRFMLLAIC